MEDNRELFDERKPASLLKSGGLAANSDILVFEGTALATYVNEIDKITLDAKVETIAISCTTGNWFSVVVRKHDGSSPITVLGPLRHNADGLLYIEENFKDPIFSYGANREVAIVNLEEIGLGQKVAASMKIWERRARKV